MLTVSDLRCIFSRLPADWSIFEQDTLVEYLQFLIGQQVDSLQLLHILFTLYDNRIEHYYPAIYNQMSQAMVHFTHANRHEFVRIKRSLPNFSERQTFFRDGVEIVRFVPILDFGKSRIQYGLHLASYARAALPFYKRTSYEREVNRQLMALVAGMSRYECQ